MSILKTIIKVNVPLKKEMAETGTDRVEPSEFQRVYDEWVKNFESQIKDAIKLEAKKQMDVALAQYDIKTKAGASAKEFHGKVLGIITSTVDKI